MRYGVAATNPGGGDENKKYSSTLELHAEYKTSRPGLRRRRRPTINYVFHLPDNGSGQPKTTQKDEEEDAEERALAKPLSSQHSLFFFCCRLEQLNN